jgi:hydrogenase maturation protein HypF
MTVRSRDPRRRCRFQVGGLVQGVGFRPFVYATAAELGLTGSVANDADGVTIEVEGRASALDHFAGRLRDRPPPLAMVVSVDRQELEVRGGTGFVIAGSHRSDRARTLASPDVSTCADCLSELADPADRRFRHPFITCTNCGPRFTIITALPYDRAQTTMAGFAMCDACRAEYEDPHDRRFHAQPIACHDCGPVLEFLWPAADASVGGLALRQAREALRSGKVVAVKGLGGYHLACDASREVAVAELRRRKRRGSKPFALMVADVAVARELVLVNDQEEALLTGGPRPIVLLARRPDADGRGVASSVAPGNPDLGVMLPHTPLHTLLFGLDGDDRGPQVLVMTSGNLGGDPIVTDDDDALSRLSTLADAWLRHDRRIQVPCDDSVVRIVDGTEMAIRRSRGYAPLPIALPFPVAPVLAVGADLKSVCAVAEGGYAWMSQHMGDMDDLATIEAFGATEKHMRTLTGVVPQRLVADAHPGYRSSQWARSHAGERAVVPVQHHHAHIASVMAEHGLDGNEQVIGIAFDGTGYGDDGGIWGGEVLVADYKHYRRASHLAYVPLAGGEVSVRRPYRMALAHLRAAGIDWDEGLACVTACPPGERDVLRHQFDTGFGCTPTSSMGRLFDAVASLTGVRHVVDFEAQAAIELEGIARSSASSSASSVGRSRAGTPDPCQSYRFGHDDALCFDAAPLIRAIVSDLHAGTDRALVAARFHQAVAELALEVAVRERDVTALNTVVLGGGVFQNSLLLSAVRRLLLGCGFSVLVPTRLPPNDGGLALGQIMITANG